MKSEIKTEKIERSKAKVGKPNKRTYYGPFRVYDDGMLKGKAHFNLMDRKRVQLNLNVCVYSTFGWPHMFRKKNLYCASTVLVPLSVIMDIAKEIEKKGIRVQKLGTHKWIKRKYRDR